MVRKIKHSLFIIILPIVSVTFNSLFAESVNTKPDPNSDIDSANTCVIEGLKISLAPRKEVFIQNEPYILNLKEYTEKNAKPIFGENEPVNLVINVHNISNEPRYLGVSIPKVDENVQMRTLVQFDDRQVDLNGIPCYIDAYPLRICSAGYSNNYKGAPLLIAPGEKATFTLDIPHYTFNDYSHIRSTGKVFIYSRFAVYKTTDTSPIIANGPAPTFLIVDPNKLSTAVESLKDALNGGQVKAYQVGNALSEIGNTPLPQYRELIVKAIKYDWPFKDQIDSRLWNSASKYISQEIYELAVAEAKRRDIIKSGHIYTTIFVNQKYLRREDILAIVEKARWKDNDFLDLDNFTEKYVRCTSLTWLFSLVAIEKDIPRLADMCADFIIKIDPENYKESATALSIHDAFFRYPDISKECLREVLKKGIVPGQFKPWAREFGYDQAPGILILIAKWLAELKDVESIPIFESYAKKPVGRVADKMQSLAPGLIAQIGGLEAMKALRRIGSGSTRWGVSERAKLGDPAAIDELLFRARGLYGSPVDDTGEAIRLLRFILLIMEPESKQSLIYPNDVEQLWKKRRPEFVKDFIAKYGFDPDAPTPPDPNSK